METRVVDVLRTPELQRLRKVRQLGLCSYVFPGAEHSRLSHSIGAAHLALRFGRQVQREAQRVFARVLVPDDHAMTDLALAALFHDLGHGPLSHAWEREIVGDAYDRPTWAKALGVDVNDGSGRTAKWHELVTQAFLAWPDGQLHRLLELAERDSSLRIRRLLSGDYYYPYLPRLISGDIDVDRADFIMRDTHNTGVAYGRFDLEWLISTCTLGQTAETSTWVVGFDKRKAVRVIEQFLIARRAMYDTVYHHKTVRCIEGMVALLLRRLKDLVVGGVVPSVGELVQPIVAIMQGACLGPSELLKLDDFAVFVLIDAVANGAFRDDTARDLARRLQARELFKMVPASSEEVTGFLSVPGNSEKLHDAVKRHVPGRGKYYVLIDRYKFEMLSRSPGSQAMLVDQDRTATRAADHDSLHQYLQPEHTQVRVFTVAPAVDALREMIRHG